MCADTSIKTRFHALYSKKVFCTRGTPIEWLEHSPLPQMALSSRQLAHGIFQKLSLFTQQKLGTQVSSEVGKVKVVRKRSGAPHLNCTSIQVPYMANGHETLINDIILWLSYQNFFRFFILSFLDKMRSKFGWSLFHTHSVQLERFINCLAAVLLITTLRKDWFALSDDLLSLADLTRCLDIVLNQGRRRYFTYLTGSAVSKPMQTRTV